MTRITETQALVLSNAAARDPGFILPLPDGCRAKGGAALKVVAGLVGRGWAEAMKGRHFKQLPEGAVAWKTDDAGEPLYPLITRAGLAAIGVEPDDAVPAEAGEEPEALEAAASEPVAAEAPKPRRAREGTKQAQMIAMLRRPEGATIGQIALATGWQPHTVRGAIAGALKKKLGLDVSSEKIDGRGRVYRLT